MSREEFEQLVAEGFGLLPAWVREKVHNVALLVEDEPSQTLRTQERLRANETLLGYYHGIPLPMRGDFYGMGSTMPDTITIFQRPILDAAKAACPPGAPEEVFREHVRRVVAETVWHEVAHHFGMDEAEVRLRERKKRER